MCESVGCAHQNCSHSLYLSRPLLCEWWESEVREEVDKKVACREVATPPTLLRFSVSSSLRQLTLSTTHSLTLSLCLFSKRHTFTHIQILERRGKNIRIFSLSLSLSPTCRVMWMFLWGYQVHAHAHAYILVFSKTENYNFFALSSLCFCYELFVSSFVENISSWLISASSSSRENDRRTHHRFADSTPHPHLNCRLLN